MRLPGYLHALRRCLSRAQSVEGGSGCGSPGYTEASRRPQPRSSRCKGWRHQLPPGVECMSLGNRALWIPLQACQQGTERAKSPWFLARASGQVTQAYTPYLCCRGDDNTNTDCRLTAERIGAAVQAIAPAHLRLGSGGQVRPGAAAGGRLLGRRARLGGGRACAPACSQQAGIQPARVRAR